MLWTPLRCYEWYCARLWVYLSDQPINMTQRCACHCNCSSTHLGGFQTDSSYHHKCMPSLTHKLYPFQLPNSVWCLFSKHVIQWVWCITSCTSTQNKQVFFPTQTSVRTYFAGLIKVVTLIECCVCERQGDEAVACQCQAVNNNTTFPLCKRSFLHQNYTALAFNFKPTHTHVSLSTHIVSSLAVHIYIYTQLYQQIFQTDYFVSCSDYLV